MDLHEVRRRRAPSTTRAPRTQAVCALDTVHTVSLARTCVVQKKLARRAGLRELEVAFAHDEVHGHIDPEKYYLTPFVRPTRNENCQVQRTVRRRGSGPGSRSRRDRHGGNDRHDAGARRRRPRGPRSPALPREI